MRHLFMALVAMPLLSLAQPAKDVYKNIWNDTLLPDSTRERALIEYSVSNRAIIPDTILKYANQALQHGMESGSNDFICYAMCFKCSYLFTTGEFSRAIELYDSCVILLENSDDFLLQALINYGLGYSYINKSEYVKSFYYSQKGLDFAKKTRWPLIISMAYNILAIYYYEIKDYNKALEHWELFMSTLHENGEFDRAVIAMNMGNAYTELKQYDKGLENFKASLKIASTSGNAYFLALIYYNMAETFDDLGQYDTAIVYNYKSIELSKSIDNKLLLAEAYLSLSSVYNHLRNYPAAIRFANLALEYNKEDGDVNLDKDIYEQFYIAYKALGNSSKALFYFERMVVLQDSIYNEESTKLLTRLEMQNEFDITEAENKAEQARKDVIALKELQEQKLIRNGFICGFAIMLLFAGVFFRQRNKIKNEKTRSDSLLLNILPSDVAEELKVAGKSKPRQFESVSILFTDFEQFTALSENLTAEELVLELNICFEAFDVISQKYRLEKIKTIGDAYMAAGGMMGSTTDGVVNAILAAIEMQRFIHERKRMNDGSGKPSFEMRVGINTGPVVAGIVGLYKFQYDIWGDTVNTANRLQQQCDTGKVNISRNTYEFVRNDMQFVFITREKIYVKGKGEMEMVYVQRAA